ncbi:uncharacterized protein [Ptychodera flava]|uniref:uncharacterized protein n=1 Tax=Ptychodera flava TaxID=63121 RepID=UPI00396A6FA0
MDRVVTEAKPVGTNLRSTCNICHRRGHRATGNRNSEGCPLGEPCRGYIFCGRSDKHKHDYMARLKQLKERESQLTKVITSKENELKQLHDFQSRSTSVFTTTITPRLLAAFPDKYNRRTTTGKTDLQRDLSILRKAFNNQVKNLPALSNAENDRTIFSRAIKEQLRSMNSEYSGCSTEEKESCTKIYDILINASPVQTMKSHQTSDLSDTECANSSGHHKQERIRKCRKRIGRCADREAENVESSQSEDDDITPHQLKGIARANRRESYRDMFYYPPPIYPFHFQPSLTPDPGYTRAPAQLLPDHVYAQQFRHPFYSSQHVSSTQGPNFPYYGMGLSPSYQVATFQDTGNRTSGQFTPVDSLSRPHNISSSEMLSETRENMQLM